MENSQKYYIEIQVRPEAPDEYKQYELEIARRKAGEMIFDILWKNKLPAVVDIQEVIEQRRKAEYWHVGYREHDMYERIRYEMTITPVTHKNIIIPSYWQSAQHRVQADEKPATVKAAFFAKNILSRFAGLFSAFRR